MDTVKTNEPSNTVSVEELGEVSRHKAISKTAANDEGESQSSVQSKALPETSPGLHPESSSAPRSPDASHAMAADSVVGCSEESKVRRTSCMYGANCYRYGGLRGHQPRASVLVCESLANPCLRVGLFSEVLPAGTSHCAFCQILPGAFKIYNGELNVYVQTC